MYGYQPKESDDELVIEALVRLAEKHPRFGFGKLFPLLRREQPMWNHKRVLRVYRALKSEKDLKQARALLTDPEITVEDEARRLGVGPSTLYRYLPAARQSAQGNGG